MEKNISYLNRTFDDYRNALIKYSKQYYPDIATDYDDASIGSWLIDINAECADNLSYHIDRVFQETNINSANEKASVMNIARNNGFKVPGPKGAMAEVKFTCRIPVRTDGDDNKSPDWSYAPIIKRGTLVASSSQLFEVMSDIDFGEQFDENGISNRTITPVVNSNGLISKYELTKLAVVVAGTSKIYSQVIYDKDIKPFMEITLPVQGVMNIESIVVKDGISIEAYPTYGEFYMPEESSSTYTSTTRFFEVDNLLQQSRWGERVNNDNLPKVYKYGYLRPDNTIYPVYSVTEGEWKPLYHKFTTEYTDKGYIKVIFGAGVDSRTEIDLSAASDFSRYQMSKIIKNDSLGVLPKGQSTIYILYRVGGGKSSNVAEGTINTIVERKTEIGKCGGEILNIATKEAVKASISVTNTTPSISGKDAPSTEEIKWMLKYNSGAKERCVTVKDYENRVLLMPPKYGTPFRVSAAEENNKIMLYLLGIDYNGHLDSKLPAMLVENIKNYLTEYRMVNDFVEIKSGKIVNLSFEADIHIDKNYNKTDVVSAVINIIKDYMDINKHNMGDDIYTGDIEKEISKVDGVLNLADFRVYNEIGQVYSQTQTTQELVIMSECTIDEQEELSVSNRLKIDLAASDGILYSDGDTMLEIKFPEQDIRIRVKEK